MSSWLSRESGGRFASVWVVSVEGGFFTLRWEWNPVVRRSAGNDLRSDPSTFFMTEGPGNSC